MKVFRRLQKVDGFANRLKDALRRLLEKADFPVGDLEKTVTRAYKGTAGLLAIVAAVELGGGKVRYFSVDDALDPSLLEPWETEGDLGFVTIANAREVTIGPVPPPRVDAAAMYAIIRYRTSIQNQRALSALLWTHIAPGSSKCLVWSDTTGGWTSRGFESLPFEDIRVTTAPHHASDQDGHREAWSALLRARRNTLFVTAGGMSKQKTSDDFLKVPRDFRACTKCGHLSYWPAPKRVGTKVPTYGAATFSTPRCPANDSHNPGNRPLRNTK